MQACPINHAKFMLNEIQSLCIEKFGENIQKLIICINKFKQDITTLHMISKKMMSNINMLGSRMLNGIFAKIYSTCIVTLNWNVIKHYAKVPKLLFLP